MEEFKHNGHRMGDGLGLKSGEKTLVSFRGEDTQGTVVIRTDANKNPKT
jgi:hypothetical protein